MRARSHDQRKGQWLINKLLSDDFPDIDYTKQGLIEGLCIRNTILERRIWCMENDQFDKLMSDYNA